jgi:hypothetical protein
MDNRWLIAACLLLSPARLLATEWTATTSIYVTNPFTPYVANVSSVRFAADLEAYMRLIYWDEDAGSYYIWHGPPDNQFPSYSLLNNDEITLFYEISGDGEKILYCNDAGYVPDRPYPYTCNLYVENQGQYESFVRLDGSIGAYTFSNAYNGSSDIELNHDGSVIVSGNTCCDNGFFGRFQVWQRQQEGDGYVYRMVVSQVREELNAYDRPTVGRSVAVADATAFTVLDAVYSDDVDTSQIFIYDVSDNTATPLSRPTATIALPDDVYGYPAYSSSLSTNRAGDHVSIALSPNDEANTPSRNGAVAIFSQTDGVWSQKGGLISGGSLLDDFGIEYGFGWVGLSESGNTAAIVAVVECYDADDDPIEPCYSGFLTVWDYAAATDTWNPRLGEGLPAKLPLSGEVSGSGHYPVEVIFDEAKQQVGVAVNGPQQDYLLKITLEEQLGGGLPIWLLYEASQQ